MNYKDICDEVCRIAREVGAFVRAERKKFNAQLIESKGKNDFVTYVDKESERRIVARLSSLVPSAGFITEEQTSVQRGELFNWIIDPIDGTTNFIHGVPPYSISIALQEGDETVVGVVYEIVLDECFSAYKGGQALLNGEHIAVSKSTTIAQSLVATGFPYNDYSRMNSYVETMKFFFTHSHGLRRIGSAATDLAYVACGRYDSFYEYSLKPWDVAAGAFIVKTAGGRVGNFSGGNDYVFTGEIIASNQHVFEEMTSVVGSFMNSNQ